jgi:hypothetical protein
MSAAHNSWKNIITFEESFFYMHKEFEQMWLARGEAPDTRERRMISSEKLMVVIGWNPGEFHVIEVLRKGQKFNACYYCSSVLIKFSKIARQVRNETPRELIFHADNARPHPTKPGTKFCAMLDLMAASNPPYSSCLAPSDCFRFGYSKNKLKCLFFPSALHLRRAIEHMVQSIDQDRWRLSTSGLFELGDVSNWMETTLNDSQKRITKMIWLIRSAETPRCTCETQNIVRLSRMYSDCMPPCVTFSSHVLVSENVKEPRC